jgi:hypothetical protein
MPVETSGVQQTRMRSTTQSAACAWNETTSYCYGELVALPRLMHAVSERSALYCKTVVFRGGKLSVVQLRVYNDPLPRSRIPYTSNRVIAQALNQRPRTSPALNDAGCRDISIVRQQRAAMSKKQPLSRVDSRWLLRGTMSAMNMSHPHLAVPLPSDQS